MTWLTPEVIELRALQAKERRLYEEGDHDDPQSPNYERATKELEAITSRYSELTDRVYAKGVHAFDDIVERAIFACHWLDHRPDGSLKFDGTREDAGAQGDCRDYAAAQLVRAVLTLAGERTDIAA